ncbi:hypothetical protein [Candidatus Contubernalis alkaliaceticus]|uniref:hypothetical protein n=1 Tax=Candidatus Contubernalis alkaliaceticus TaxID=338645 RepID=UPI001F4C1AC2|nr:hypothetical protein [Candidatus Contubernalis alkalaceticus]UNC92912.1 hypothetical protein HUE98_12875 [Candidatus Contubernalis alkalaceticus]
MKILLFLLLALAVVLAFLLLTVLLLPLTYRVKAGYGKEFFAQGGVSQMPLYSFLFSYCPQEARVHLKFLFIPFSFQVNPGEQKEKKPRKKKENKKQKEKESSSQKDSSKFIKVFMKRSTLEHMLSLLWDLLGILKPEKLEIRGEIGLEEPHLLGWLLAFLWSFKSLCNIFRIELQPLWDREHYDLEVNLEGKMVPGAVLFRLLKFLFSKRTLEIWRQWRKQKKIYKTAT